MEILLNFLTFGILCFVAVAFLPIFLYLRDITHIALYYNNVPCGHCGMESHTTREHGDRCNICSSPFHYSYEHNEKACPNCYRGLRYSSTEKETICEECQGKGIMSAYEEWLKKENAKLFKHQKSSF